VFLYYSIFHMETNRNQQVNWMKIFTQTHTKASKFLFYWLINNDRYPVFGTCVTLWINWFILKLFLLWRMTWFLFSSILMPSIQSFDWHHRLQLPLNRETIEKLRVIKVSQIKLLMNDGWKKSNWNFNYRIAYVHINDVWKR
jgi:hypothetical protein